MRYQRHPGKALLLILILAIFLTACGETGPLAGNEQILYQDNFSVGETGPWLVEGDSAGRSAVIDEQLVIRISTPGTMQFVTLPEPQFSDFSLQVDARLLNGSPQSSYGVLFRMESQTEFYRFAVTGDGMYMVERRNNDGSWARFVTDWTGAPVINQGVGAVNQLRVDAVGSTMRFFINGSLVHQVTDSQYASGTIALDAGTFGQGDLEVAFDNLVVKRP